MEWGKMEVGYWKDSEDGWTVLKINDITGVVSDTGCQGFYEDYTPEEDMSDKLVWLGYVAKGLC